MPGTPVARAADANPPDRLTYQGFLVDSDGVALGNSAPKNFDVIFRIYDSQSGGTRKWTEQQTVTVDKGYFSVLLGEGAQVSSELREPLSTLFAGADASDRYVEITVKGVGAGGSDSTIVPRLRLLTSTYAFLAKHAVNADNLVNAANITSGTIDSERLRLSDKSIYLRAAPDVTFGLGFIGSANTYSANRTFAAENVDGPVLFGYGGGALGVRRGSAQSDEKIALRWDANANVTVPGTISGNGTIPIGGIIMWNGSTVPAGWALCDGNNGTPNLSGRFVLGIGGTNSLGATGGAATHTLTVSELPSHNHSVDPPSTATDSDTHNHTISSDYGSGIGSASSGDYVLRNIDGNTGPNKATSSSTHDHTVNIASFTSGSTGGNGAHNNMPPYYVLAFIMRVQ